MDGPGAPRVLETLGKKVSRNIRVKELQLKNVTEEEKLRIIRKYFAQGIKDIILESGEGKILGTSDVKNIVLPGIIDGGIRHMKKQHRDGALITKPWTPQILPLQWIQIGQLLFVAFPFALAACVCVCVSACFLITLYVCRCVCKCVDAVQL